MSQAFDSFEEAVEEQVDRELSENVAENIVEVSRGSLVGNEEVVLLGCLQYGTAWCYDMDRFANSVKIGPPGGGKSEAQSVEESMVPSKFVYGGGDITDFSDNAPLDDPDWDRSLLFIGDEYDKINKTIQEYFKSMAGGADEGYGKKRNVESDTAEGGYEPVTVSSSAMPFQFLYAPVGSKGGLAEELDDRMLKLPVEHSKTIQQGIQRKEFGHEDISTVGLDHTYIYDTHDLQLALRRHMRQLPVVEVYEDGTTEVVPGHKSPKHAIENLESRRGGVYTVMPKWVAYATEPIFDQNSPHSNRVFGMISNLIRSSSIWNHHQRDRVEKSIEGETEEAILVTNQDVANVLCTQQTLLGTTHLLDQRKRDYLDAIDATQGLTEEGAVTLQQIRQWLDDNDRTCPTEGTIRNHLEELAENFYVRIRDGAGPNGAHLYEIQPHGSIQPPRLYNLTEPAKREDVELDGLGCPDVDDPFEGTWDPIRDQPFKETVEVFESKFGEDDLVEKRASQAMSAADAMGGGDSSGSSEGQQSLGDLQGDSDTAGQAQRNQNQTGAGSDDATPGVRAPQTPVQKAVYERLLAECGTEGKPFDLDADHDVEDPHLLGVADPKEPVTDTDFSGTIYDPTHNLWDHDAIDDGRVTSEEDARREIDDAITDLESMRLIQYSEPSDGFLAVTVEEVGDL